MLSFVFQLTTPNFPVVVKLGHAHAGMGKVSKRKKKNIYIYMETDKYVALHSCDYTWHVTSQPRG